MGGGCEALPLIANPAPKATLPLSANHAPKVALPPTANPTPRATPPSTTNPTSKATLLLIANPFPKVILFPKTKLGPPSKATDLANTTSCDATFHQGVAGTFCSPTEQQETPAFSFYARIAGTSPATGAPKYNAESTTRLATTRGPPQSGTSVHLPRTTPFALPQPNPARLDIGNTPPPPQLQKIRKSLQTAANTSNAVFKGNMDIARMPRSIRYPTELRCHLCHKALHYKD